MWVASPLISVFQLYVTGLSSIILSSAGVSELIFFLSRRSEAQIIEVVFGLMKQIPVAFWKEATFPETL